MTVLLIALMLATVRPVSQPVVGVFCIPGWPYFGNTWQVLNNPSKVFSEWSEKYRQSCFVIHLGNTPVVVVNSFSGVHDLWLLNSLALGSRPTLHTFHNVVSAVQGLTVGSTPAGESYKRKKKCLSLHLSAKTIAGAEITETIDYCSRKCLQNLANSPGKDLLLLRHAQYYVLSAAIRLTYGINLDCHAADKDFACNIIETENHIIRMRSLIANYQDYISLCQVPPIRWFFESRAKYWSNKRDAYMRELYSKFLDNMHQGTRLASQCMLAHILREKFSAMSLSEVELQSICLTMVSAGLDNSALTFDHLIGQLSQPSYGYTMQEKLYDELLTTSKNSISRAWSDTLVSTDCAYAMALILESLRHFSVLPLGLPRKTLKGVHYSGMYIPQGTIVIMNNYAANHDSGVFKNPYQFNPCRWLDEHGALNDSASHFSFGAGSRKCSGNHLATKELYILLCRMALLFRIKETKHSCYKMELDPFEGNLWPSATSFEPKEFRVSLEQRHDTGITQTLLLS